MQMYRYLQRYPTVPRDLTGQNITAGTRMKTQASHKTAAYRGQKVTCGEVFSCIIG